MKEKDYQCVFNKWVKNVFKQTACFELKKVTGNSIPFDAVAPHQIEALENANHGVLAFKIPDCGYQNPFDSFCLSKVPAFIVLCFQKKIELISIDTFILEKQRSKRKSLTSGRASELSTITIKL